MFDLVGGGWGVGIGVELNEDFFGCDYLLFVMLFGNLDGNVCELSFMVKNRWGVIVEWEI